MHPTTEALLRALRTADLDLPEHKAWREAGGQDVPFAEGWYYCNRPESGPTVAFFCGPVADYTILCPVPTYDEYRALLGLKEAHTPRKVEPAPAVVVRTEEEARKEPRRGDRWQYFGGTYTLTRPEKGDKEGGWRGIGNGETTEGLWLPGRGDGTETYLGNFAHELDAHPAPFVPTEPGWYWVEQRDGTRYPARWEHGFGRNAMKWLGPVAPWVAP